MIGCKFKITCILPSIITALFFYGSANAADESVIIENLFENMTYPNPDADLDEEINFRKAIQNDLTIVFDQHWKRKTLVSDDFGDVSFHKPMARVFNSTLYVFYMMKDGDRTTLYEKNLLSGETYRITSTRSTDLVYGNGNIEFRGNQLFFMEDLEWVDSNQRNGRCYDIGSSSRPSECSFKSTLDLHPKGSPIDTQSSPDGRYLAITNYNTYTDYSKYAELNFDETELEKQLLNNIKEYSGIVLHDYFLNKTELLFPVGYTSYWSIGEIAWAEDSKTFYFDNSGPIACIWEYSVEERELQKIVPEHNAAKPFHLQIGQTNFVFYVENKYDQSATLKVATP